VQLDPTAFPLGLRFLQPPTPFTAACREPRHRYSQHHGGARDAGSALLHRSPSPSPLTANIVKHCCAPTCDRSRLPRVAAANNRTTMGSRNVIRQPQPLTLLKPRAHRRGPNCDVLLHTS
jgi:hypothetical protein